MRNSPNDAGMGNLAARLALTLWLLGLALLLLPISTTAHYGGANGEDVTVSSSGGDACGPALYARLHETVADDGTRHHRDADCSARAGGRIAFAVYCFVCAVPLGYVGRRSKPGDADV